jgi:hypothetical protein
MKRSCLVGILSLIGVAMDVAAHAGGRRYPIIGWGGNEYLFEVSILNGRTQLIGYRAVGSRWKESGRPRSALANVAPSRAFFRRFGSKVAASGPLDADMNNPYWRVVPGQEHGGGSIWP